MRKNDLKKRWRDMDIDLRDVPYRPRRDAAAEDDAETRWEMSQARQLEEAELRFFKTIYPIVAVVLCILLSTVLVLTVAYLPPFGRETSPTNNEVSQRYVEDAVSETGAVNAVAGMIIYFRGFDTLGEAHVLFTSVCAVMILLMTEPDKNLLRRERREERLYDLTRDPILREVVRILVPVIFLFGIYVIFNGHLSPGGGFSGGTIIGAGLILHSVAFGFADTEHYFNEKVYDAIKVTALLIYSAIMLYFFYTGANDLPAWIPRGTAGNIFSAGFILPINFVVGFEVACTMYGLYSLFRRGRI